MINRYIDENKQRGVNQTNPQNASQGGQYQSGANQSGVNQTNPQNGNQSGGVNSNNQGNLPNSTQNKTNQSGVY